MIGYPRPSSDRTRNVRFATLTDPKKAIARTTRLVPGHNVREG